MDNHLTEKDTDTFLENIGEGVGYAKAYVSQEIQSVKLEAAEKISIASSNFITALVLTSVGSLVVIFASIALGFYLGAVWNSNALGFLLVAGLYLLFFVLFYVFRRPLITDRIVSSVISLFFDQENQDEPN